MQFDTEKSVDFVLFFFHFFTIITSSSLLLFYCVYASDYKKHGLS